MEKEWTTLIAYLGFKVHSMRVCCFLQHFQLRHYSFLRPASISSMLFTLVSHSNLFPQLQRLHRLHVHFFFGFGVFFVFKKLPSIFPLFLLSTTVSFWVLPISLSLIFNVHLYFIVHCSCFLCHILTTHLHNPSCCTWPLHHATEKCIPDPEQARTHNCAACGLTTATRCRVEASPTLVCQRFQAIIYRNRAICGLFKRLQWDTANIATNYP